MPEPAGEMDSVPVTALQMPDDQDQMTPPEVGDEVSYTVTGKVVSIEGGTARIERKTINGQEIEAPEPEESDEAESLMAEAEGMDAKGMRF